MGTQLAPRAKNYTEWASNDYIGQKIYLAIFTTNRLIGTTYTHGDLVVAIILFYHT